MVAFLRCYYFQVAQSSGQYYFCPNENDFCFVEHIKENFKNRDVFFKVESSELVLFLNHWKKPRRMHFHYKELTEGECNNAASLQFHFKKEGTINGTIIQDPKLMDHYFGDKATDDSSGIYFNKFVQV